MVMGSVWLGKADPSDSSALECKDALKAAMSVLITVMWVFLVGGFVLFVCSTYPPRRTRGHLLPHTHTTTPDFTFNLCRYRVCPECMKGDCGCLFRVFCGCCVPPREHDRHRHHHHRGHPGTPAPAHVATPGYPVGYAVHAPAPAPAMAPVIPPPVPSAYPVPSTPPSGPVPHGATAPPVAHPAAEPASGEPQTFAEQVGGAVASGIRGIGNFFSKSKGSSPQSGTRR